VSAATVSPIPKGINGSSRSRRKMRCAEVSGVWASSGGGKLDGGKFDDRAMVGDRVYDVVVRECRFARFRLRC
jgi:hypothetical protein